MEHSMRLGALPFSLIKEGKKVIESRLFDEKRRTISVGDTIVFSNGEHIVTTEVIGLLQHHTFKELFASQPPELFGGTSGDQLLSQIREFYSEEEEAKYGVLGIHLKKL